MRHFHLCFFMVVAIVAITRNLPVFYNTNPDLVRSAISFAALQEFTGGDLVSSEVTLDPSSSGVAKVSLRLKQTKNLTEGGILTQENIAYALKLQTRSRCYELDPGCLAIKRKLVLETVAIKAAM
jgi:hypothetical protein